MSFDEHIDIWDHGLVEKTLKIQWKTVEEIVYIN